MKRKLISCTVIAIALAGGLFAVYKYIEETNKEKMEKVRVEQEIKDAVAQLTTRYNAVADWDKPLSLGKKHRKSPVLGIELERLWQGDRPVLLIGFFRDISSTGPNTYKVVVVNGPGKDCTFDTDLVLSLRAPKETIDSFLEQHPNVLDRNGIAVVAKVTNISMSEDWNVLTGHGELLGIVYAGDVMFGPRPTNNGD